MAERPPRSAKQLMRSRMPIALIIAKQRARLVKIDERIGHLMTQRADEEDILADLIAVCNKITERGVE
jgi:hypothetical protein